MATAAATDPRVPGHTITQWADALVGKIAALQGWKLTAAQRQADDVGLITWANTESGGYNPNVAGGRNNPLNTTEGALGFTGQGGSQGDIKDFGSFDQGVDAQAYNLVHTQGAGYGAILEALKSGNTQGLYSAVDASAFGTHGLGKGGTPSAPSGAGSSSSSGAQLTGVDLNPLNWWGDITGGLKGDIAKVGVTLAILGAGLVLIVMGAWRSVSPETRKSITSTAKSAGEVAALA